jgi:RNA polymerase sigma factor (TIGR02999 family)
MAGDRRETEPVSTHEVTRLLQAWGSGDEAALEQLMPLVYNELHRLAQRYMAREQSGHPLQTTALVHEVYLRLVDVKNVDWQNRAHFQALCARLMRRILIDFARSRNYQKREGRFPHIELEEAATVSAAVGSELLAVDEALKLLAAVDTRKSEVVELRFFGGLTTEEIAAALHVSPETVMRDWKLAKAWLLRELSHEDRHEA